MDTVIKGFLGVFIFAMIVYLSAGLISAEMDTHAARSYMDSAKKEIAESNMSPTVITAVQEQAARNGYQMQITTYGDVLETDGVELKMSGSDTHGKGICKLMENLIKQNGETLVYIALFLPVIGGLAEVLKVLSSL